MITPEKLREAFKRHRYGGGEYEPDYDLLDVAADEIERLRGALKRIADTKNTEGYHTRQATNLQRIAEEALGIFEQERQKP